MEIIEVKEVKFCNQIILLSKFNIFSVLESSEKTVLNIENLELDLKALLDSDSTIQICSEIDLYNTFESINIYDVELAYFRIKIIENSKWGRKPIFIGGQNNVCFSCFIINQNKVKILILFNTLGSKEIEEIYIHGIWIVNFT